MNDTLLIAAAAAGASEATGVTNLTPIGPSGGDENDDPPNSVARGIAPGLIGALRSATSGDDSSGGIPELDFDLGSGRFDPGSGLSDGIDELAARLDATTDEGATTGTLKDNAGELGTLVENLTGDGSSDDSGTTPEPSGGDDDFSPWDAIQMVRDFDAGDAGTTVGEGTTDFTQNAAEGVAGGIGEAVGSVPFALIDGATDAGSAAGNSTRRWIADVTGAEGDGEGVNADRPGAGITDVLDMVASGEQGPAGDDPKTVTELPGAVYEDVQGRLSGGLTGDPDTSILGGGSNDSGSSGGGSSGGSSGGGSNDSGSSGGDEGGLLSGGITGDDETSVFAGDLGGDAEKTGPFNGGITGDSDTTVFAGDLGGDAEKTGPFGLGSSGGGSSGGSSGGGSNDSGSSGGTDAAKKAVNSAVGSEDPEDEDDGTDYATDGRWGL